MTLKLTKILVALDGSHRAGAVLASAVHLAQTANARLVLYRAISISPELPRELFGTTEAQLEDVLMRHARTDLSRLAEGIPAELLAGVVTSFATPWDGICRTARDQEVDLIVIGSHGYGVIDRVVGTVAAKVVNHADRNVLVVRTTI